MSQVIDAPSDIWKAPDDVITTVKQLIAKFHTDLILIEDQIAVIFKEKASKSGEAVIAGKTSKASKLIGILGETDYKFIITLGHDVWADYSDTQRVALLDHHLCACRGVEKDDGTWRYFIQPPDVAFYKDEVARHGFWRTSGAAADEDLIAELFGDEDEE